MTMPTVAVVTTDLDQTTDSPAAARTALLDAVQKLNQMIAHISSFAATILDDTDAATMRATLGAQAALGFTPYNATNPSGFISNVALALGYTPYDAANPSGFINGAGNAATATKLSTASGSAPSYSARAWCVFDGTVAGTNAPIAGGNVSSVTRNGVGDYTINFSTTMPDANYATHISCQTVGVDVAENLNGNTAQTASARRVFTSSGVALSDSNLIAISVFR